MDNDSNDNIKGSTIYYRAFPNQKQLFGANESFTYTLSKGENVTALALGKGWCACTTSKNMLRIFSSTGIQLSIFQLKGPVVCLIGLQSKLAVIYHKGLPIHKTPSLNTDIYDITVFGLRDGNKESSATSINLSNENIHVPITSRSELEWAGFDIDSLILYVLDQSGLLSALIFSSGWQWVPVLDINTFRKTVDYKYWPIQVKGNKFVYVLLNGETKPSIYPVPITSTKLFKIPIIPVFDTTSKDKGEAQNERIREALWKSLLLNHHNNALSTANTSIKSSEDIQVLEEQIISFEKEADKSLLKLMQEACRLQKVGLAMDLIQRLRLDVSLNAAIKVADHFSLPKVAEAIEEIKDRRQRILEDQQRSPDEFEAPTVTTYESKPVGFGREENCENYSDTEDYVSTRNMSQEFTNTDMPMTSKVNKPLNPFAINHQSASLSESANNSNKRKTFLDGIQDMKGSPSPKKTALLVSLQLHYL